MCFHQWSRQQVFTSATADALQAELSRYQTRLEQHISQQNNGNSTVGDVLGQRNAQIDPLPYLAGSLPYSVKARSQPFSEIPDARRAQFKYEIYPDSPPVVCYAVCATGKSMGRGIEPITAC